MCILYVKTCVWLKKLDIKMKTENRKILLFIDNCTAHPSELSECFENVKVMFFPSNLTSKCQPIDQGVIHSFKSFYKNGLSKKNNNVTT